MVGPRPGGDPQVAAEHEVGAGGLEPRPQARPRPEGDLVNDLHAVPVPHDQATGDQGVDRRYKFFRDVGEFDATADPAAVLRDVGHEEQRPPYRLLPGAAPDGVEHAGPETLDGSLHAAQRLVLVDRQLVADALFPQLGHRGGDQRQRTVGVADIRQHRRHECRFDPVTGPHRGLLDDPAQLLVARPADEHRRVLDQLGHVASLRQSAVVVSPYHEHDVGVEGGVQGEIEKPADQPVDDGRRADERLLELVDDDQLRPRLIQAGELVERPQRILAWNGHVDAPRRLARQPTALHQRDQPGPRERRLAAARRAGDDDHPTVQHPGGQLGDETFPTDEDVGIHRSVGRQPPVGLAAEPRLARQLMTPRTGVHEAGDLLHDRVAAPSAAASALADAAAA